MINKSTRGFFWLEKHFAADKKVEERDDKKMIEMFGKI
jgi:hypothetical protein